MVFAQAHTHTHADNQLVNLLAESGGPEALNTADAQFLPVVIVVILPALHLRN